MPEIRKDPVFGRWVIIASERSLRPNQFREVAGKNAYHCPFCPGNEAETPPSIYTLSAENGEGAKAQRNKGTKARKGKNANWRLRVVRNKYPALQPEGDTINRVEGIYDRMDGMGFHEVVIETPVHSRQMEDMEVSGIADILKTYILRVNEIKKDHRIKYVMVFKNHGASAGASISHSHSQIIAMPMTPIRVVQEITGSENYRRDRGSCVFCDIVREEAGSKKRVLEENENFLALTPYASRFSFELWILPKKHLSHFENADAALMPDLAGIIKGVLGKLKRSLAGPSYNLIVHTMPVQDPEVGHYHWHIEIMPKMSMVAGFEWGTGFYINTVSPEDAAKILNTGKKYKF
ncbi:MAG: galactose-1-phosphate uridylyltransferase [Elusimicrobia bacterium]|nr:galactose-1-phosphate uridylyltransferase [Elusimicrobiota bacterium]